MQENIDLAEVYSEWFLTDVRKMVGEVCWLAMRSYEAGGVSWLEKRSTFSLKWMLWPSEIRAYRNACFAFVPVRSDPAFVVRWLDDQARRDIKSVSGLWGGLP